MSIKEIFKASDTTITADKESIDIEIQYENGDWNGSYAMQTLSKAGALALASSIIEYYKNEL